MTDKELPPELEDEKEKTAQFLRDILDEE